MTTSQGSPFWQGIIFFAALAFLLWEAWRGWRSGVVRSGLNFAALVLSSVIGFMAAQVAAAPFGGFTELSGIAAGVAIGGGIALIVFLIVWIMGAVLFKRTEHQKSGLVRFFWGLGGAFFGILLGLLFLWGGVSMIRSLGTLAQARVSRPPEPGKPPAPPPAVASGLVTLKDSLELGPAGKIVESVDPIPPDVYTLIADASKVTGDQALMTRLVEYPGIQQLMQNPKVAALLSDPDIVRAAEEKNIMALISNKSMLAAVQDPEFSKELSKIDIRAALNFALEPSAPSPSPSPLPKKKK